MAGRPRFTRIVATLLVIGAVAVPIAVQQRGSAKALATSRTVDQAEVSLPFGLEIVEGSELVARPFVAEKVVLEYNGVDVSGVVLTALLRVPSDDSESVFRGWIDQLATLNSGEVAVTMDDDFERSGARAFGYRYTGAAPVGDSSSLDWWPNGDETLIVLEVTRYDDTVVETTVSWQPTFDLRSSRQEPYGGAGRGEGSALFTEQSFTVHVPPGATTLADTLPMSAGTGGSFSVLSALGGRAALQDLLDQATNGSDWHDPPVLERLETGTDEVAYRALFNISAGGWGFEALSIQAPDEAAVIYVSSWAD